MHQGRTKSVTTHQLSPAPPHRIERPIMRQQWQDLAYLHWPYEAKEVQGKLPPGLSVDTFGDMAWVGLVPFHMVGIAPGVGPEIPYLGTFPETNIRTYVVGPDGPGVWFHSLDINRVLPVAVARSTYRLPYTFSKMSIEKERNRITYRARRRWPDARGATSTVTLDVGGPIDRPSELDIFLSARWRLYTMLGDTLTSARVDHEPWPLHHATLRHFDDQLVEAAGYAPPDHFPHLLFSPGVSVRVDRPRRVA